MKIEVISGKENLLKTNFLQNKHCMLVIVIDFSKFFTAPFSWLLHIVSLILILTFCQIHFLVFYITAY